MASKNVIFFKPPCILFVFVLFFKYNRVFCFVCLFVRLFFDKILDETKFFLSFLSFQQYYRQRTMKSARLYVVLFSAAVQMLCVLTSKYYIIVVVIVTFAQRGFARRGKQSQTHDFAPLLGFLFLQRGMERNNKTRYCFRFT